MMPLQKLYYRTVFVYDLQGRRAATVQYAQDGTWQADHQIYDWRDRIIEIKRGISMNPPVFADLAGASNFTTVQKTVYDGNHIDKVLSFFDTGANDYIGEKYHYDLWNRVRASASYSVTGGTEIPFGPYTVNDYDWRGNVVFTGTFETEPNWNNVLANDHFASTATGKLSAAQNHYDIQDRLWKSGTFNNVSHVFDEITFKYDLSDRRTESAQDNKTTQIVYDALGRSIETRTLNGTVLLTVNRTQYDAAGNAVGQESLTLNPNEISGINESGTNFVRRTVYSWYDKAGRPTIQADYGSGAATWTNAAKPARPDNVPENSTAEYLITKVGYNTAGQQETLIDPKGKITKTFYDALGRSVKTLDNAGQNE
ncbi:hypothetical protein FACS1894189_6900 [Planctomycetales bacterium]|nr:hypothetical protein FACS1894189_6900 [Planctomycetales bacterium]